MKYLWILIALSCWSCGHSPNEQQECRIEILRESSRVILEGQNRFYNAYNQIDQIKDSANPTLQVFQNIIDILRIRADFVSELDEQEAASKAFNKLLDRLMSKVDEPDKLQNYCRAEFNLNYREEQVLTDCEKEYLKLVGLLLAEEAMAMNARNVST